MRPRTAIRSSRLISALGPAPTPITVMRPPTARDRTSSRRLGRPIKLEHHVERSVGGEALGCDHGHTELGDSVGEVGVPHRRHHVGAGGDSQLHAGDPDAPGGAVHAQRLADGESGLGEHGVVRGGERLGETSGPGPVEGVGHGER